MTLPLPFTVLSVVFVPDYDDRDRAAALIGVGIRHLNSMAARCRPYPRPSVECDPFAVVGGAAGTLCSLVRGGHGGPT